MKWTDAEDIGIALSEKFPGVDPLTSNALIRACPGHK